MIKAVAALAVVLAILFAFAHPSPFRTPDYLDKRTRWNDTLTRESTRETTGRFLGDTTEVRAYAVASDSVTEIRFSNLVPRITLAEKFERVTHIETVNDIDHDGSDELYFIAVERNSCNAVGILTEYADGKWIELKSLSQYGCAAEYPNEHHVSVDDNHRYLITYKTAEESDEETYSGTISDQLTSR